MFAMQTKDRAAPIVGKSGIEKGVIVKILHKSTYEGRLATVMDPDFEGRVRVRIEADKSLRTFEHDEVELFAKKVDKNAEEDEEEKYARISVNIIVHKAGSHTRSGGYATCQILRQCEKGVTFEAWLELTDSKRRAMKNPQDLEEISSVGRFTQYPELKQSGDKKKRYVCVRAIYIDPSHLGLAAMHRIATEQALNISRHEKFTMQAKYVLCIHSVRNITFENQRSNIQVREYVKRDAYSSLEQDQIVGFISQEGVE